MPSKEGELREFSIQHSKEGDDCEMNAMKERGADRQEKGKNA